MSKFVRAAQTSHTLSVAAMEEASRLGIREADIEHLFLALVIDERAAGLALRSVGITIDAARHAVAEQHRQQLASLGIDGGFPEGGRIVFHETEGYDWTERARELLAQASSKDRAGDSAAVLRELLAEPSGFMPEILARLDAETEDVRRALDAVEMAAAPASPSLSTSADRVGGSVETFASAPKEDVRAFLADALRIPEWEPSIGIVRDDSEDGASVATWIGIAPTTYPDGKPAKVKPPYRRRSITRVAASHPDTIAWAFGFPDAAHPSQVVTEFRLTETPGGTQVHITRAWSRRSGWRRVLVLPLRPLQMLLLWISLRQTASAISRAFR